MLTVDRTKTCEPPYFDIVFWKVHLPAVLVSAERCQCLDPSPYIEYNACRLQGLVEDWISGPSDKPPMASDGSKPGCEEQAEQQLCGQYGRLHRQKGLHGSWLATWHWTVSYETSRRMLSGWARFPDVPITDNHDNHDNNDR